jgi:hypothetical protein
MATFQVSTTTATLVAATAYSAIELRPVSSTPIQILKWWVDLNSATSSNPPVLVQAGKFSAAVTTNTSSTPLAIDYRGQDTTANTAAGVNATSEGAGTWVANGEVHSLAPQGFPFAVWETEDTALWVPGGSFWRIRITPGSAITTTTATCGVLFKE